jgi:hypothetical protein
MIDFFGSLVQDRFGVYEFALEKQAVSVVNRFFMRDQRNFKLVVAFF